MQSLSCSLAQGEVQKMAIRDLSGATVLFCKCGVYLRLADSPPVREVLQHEKVLYNADGRNKYYEQCVEE